MNLPITVFEKTSATAAKLFKFSECTVLMFPREHVEVSMVVLTTWEYSQVRSDFIWYLNTDPHAESRPGNSYSQLVTSRVPSIYLEVFSFTRVYFVCLPCFTRHPKWRNLIRLRRARKNGAENIRERWTMLHKNTQRNTIHYAHPFLQVSNYFYPGQRAPCSYHPYVAANVEKFGSHDCAMILISTEYNFTLTFGHMRNLPGIHSSLQSRSVFGGRLIYKLFEFGLMISSYDVGSDAYAFIVCHEKKDLFANQQQFNGVLRPFPVWVWISIGAVGLGTSTLLTWKRRQFELDLSCAQLDSWFMFSALLVEQAVPTIPWKGTLTKHGLWFEWENFCLIIYNEYKGFIFSTLAIRSPPTVPGTPDELTKSDLLIGSSYYMHVEPGLKALTLKRAILPDLLSKEKDETVRKKYTYLTQHVRWFTDTFEHASVQIGMNRTLKVDSNLIRIKSRFSFVDPVWRTKLLKKLDEQVGVFWV